MKISKKYGPYDTHPSVYYQLLLDGKCFCTIKNKDRGEEILKRWNEYDELKAKAELFDEAINRLELVLGFLNYCKDELSHRDETQLHRDWIEEVLSKAKELSK